MTEFEKIITDKYKLSLDKASMIFNKIEDLKLNKDAFTFLNVKMVKDQILYFNKKPLNMKKDKEYIVGIYVLSDLYQHDKKLLDLFDPSETSFIDIFKLYNGEDLNNKTIFIFRTGGIGDLIFIQPSLFELKKKYPTCKIWFGTISPNIGMIRNWSCIDRIITMPFETEDFIKADYHCSFQGVIEKTKQAEKENAYVLFNKWLNLNSETYNLRPILSTEKNHDKFVKKLLKKNNIEKYVYIQPNASVVLRTPGLTTWLYIISYFVDKGIKVIMNTKPEHSKMVDYIINYVKPEFRKYIFNFSKDSINLQRMMSFIKMSTLVIAPDSSSIHIAAGLNKPVYGIYGPFPGEIRMSTYKNAQWIEPEITKDQCTFGGKHCCLHTSQPCPFNIKQISKCFYNFDYEKMFKHLDSYSKLF